MTVRNPIKDAKRKIGEYENEKKELENAIEVLTRAGSEEDLSPLRDKIKKLDMMIGWQHETISQYSTLKDAAKFAETTIMEFLSGYNESREQLDEARQILSAVLQVVREYNW